ncbi:hypothetical protein AVEN_250156-1, partial [Araneus ventricosus]
GPLKEYITADKEEAAASGCPVNIPTAHYSKDLPM